MKALRDSTAPTTSAASACPTRRCTIGAAPSCASPARRFADPICTSSHGTVPTPPGTVIGHEGRRRGRGGRRRVQRFRKGQRVIVPGVVGCGDCDTAGADIQLGGLNQLFKVYGTSPSCPARRRNSSRRPAPTSTCGRRPTTSTTSRCCSSPTSCRPATSRRRNARITPGATAWHRRRAGGLFAAAPRASAEAASPAIDRIPYRLARASACGAIAVDASRAGCPRASLGADRRARRRQRHRSGRCG